MTVSLQASRVLWDQNWFDEAAAEEVVLATGLLIQNDFDLVRIAAALTRIVNHSVSDQLSTLRSAIEWTRALSHARAALAYQDFAMGWSKAGENMMRLSNDQLFSLQHFEEFAQSQVSNKVKRNTKIWIKTLYTEALGLFGAAFAQEPMSYVSDSNKNEAHGVVFFIRGILEHVSRVQIRCGYSARVFPNSDTRIDWGLHDLGTIGTHVATHKRVVLGNSSRPLWQERRDEFLSIS